MPRGRKRKHVPFVPPRWIHNTSSEDEPMEQDPVHHDGKCQAIEFIIPSQLDY